MRKILLVFAVCFGLIGSAYAQQTVTGTVTGDDGLGLPGVTVLQQGTTNGTTTNADGYYSLRVPSDAVLVFSFVGMSTKEVEIGGQTVVDATLENEDVGIDEVVVTALGVTRDKKSLGYAVQEVAGDEVSTAKDGSFISSLSGKVSGVHIKKAGQIFKPIFILLRLILFINYL